VKKEIREQKKAFVPLNDAIGKNDFRYKGGAEKELGGMDRQAEKDLIEDAKNKMQELV